MALNINICLDAVYLFIAWNNASQIHRLGHKNLTFAFYMFLLRGPFYQGWPKPKSQKLMRKGWTSPEFGTCGSYNPGDHKTIVLAWNGGKRNRISAGQRDRGDISRRQLESVGERGCDLGRKVMCRQGFSLQSETYFITPQRETWKKLSFV